MASKWVIQTVGRNHANLAARWARPQGGVRPRADRFRGNRHLSHLDGNLIFCLLNSHGICQIRLRKNGRNPGHSELRPGFVPQGLSESSNSVLGRSYKAIVGTILSSTVEIILMTQSLWLALLETHPICSAWRLDTFFAGTHLASVPAFCGVYIGRASLDRNCSFGQSFLGTSVAVACF
jgi:hypothetical protein